MSRQRPDPESWKYPALAADTHLRILVIKPRALGDVLLSTVVLRNLRNAFPDATIDFFTEKPADQLLAGRPELDLVHAFSRRNDSILRMFVTLWRRRYDLVFDLFCNPRSAQLAFATRARVRVGYPFRGRAWAYTTHVTSRSDDVHNVEFNLDPLRHLGIPITDTTLTVPFDPEDAEYADRWIATIPAGAGPLVALNSSGTWETKRWGLAHFAELGDLLVERLGARCVFLWGPGERDDVDAILAMMRHEAYAAPPTNLRRLAALLSRCGYMISNDSGPMHIAAAAGVPTLGIFGPTNPLLQGPYNARSAWVRNESVACLACNRTTCPVGNICMTGLAPERVYGAFVELVARNTR